MNLINWRPKTVSSYQSLPNAFERMIDDNFFVNNDNNNCVLVALIAVLGQNCKDAALRGRTESM